MKIDSKDFVLPNAKIKLKKCQLKLNRALSPAEYQNILENHVHELSDWQRLLSQTITILCC